MATIYHQVWIDAPASRVYEGVAGAAGLSGWWAPHTSTETVDGLVLAHNPGPEHGEVRMKVLDMEQDRRVEWEIISSHPRRSPAFAWTGTHIIFEISERENPGALRGIGSRSPRLSVVEFRHTGWDEDSEFLGFCNFAWGGVLGMLKRWCETPRGRKECASEFLRLAASGDVREAYRKYVAPGFRHHNPFFPGDAESLMAAMEENAVRNPDKTLEIQRVLEDGDLVAVHSRITREPGDRGAAVVHIMRFEGDLIAELWDIGQAMPEDSPNQHGMF